MKYKVLPGVFRMTGSMSQSGHLKEFGPGIKYEQDTSYIDQRLQARLKCGDRLTKGSKTSCRRGVDYIKIQRTSFAEVTEWYRQHPRPHKAHPRPVTLDT